MAVAPLFLLPFASLSAAVVTMFWLAGFGFIWVLMEPSRRRNEMPHDARARVTRAMLVDPLFWFSLVLVAYAGIRSCNGGIGLVYDAETMVWSVSPPVLPLFPGCVDGTADFAFATIVSLAIIFQGVRHALGRSARVAFLLVSSVLSSLAAISLALAVSYRNAGVLSLADISFYSSSYFGTSFGIQLLIGLVALFSVVGNQWMKAEPLAAFGMIGNAVGLVLFSPAATIAAFSAAFLLLAVLSFVVTRHVFEGSGSFRCALAVLMAAGAAALYAISSAEVPGMAAKLAAITELRPFPGDYWNVRSVLSSIALKTWENNPWLGTGIESFPLDIRFAAVSADWQVISPVQKTALNGWWQLLAERGVIGAGFLAVMFGLLLWTYGSRLISSFSDIRLSPELFLGPIVLVVMIGLSFVNCSFLRPEVLLLTAALLAFSGGALPDRARLSGEVKEG